MITVTRAEWNARPWTSFTLLNWSRVDKFIVHYSGAVRSQTVRGIQDYCMDVKGHSDIDYNDVVKDGKRYLGRGNHVGGHTLNNNSTSYGVCVVGLDGDATPEDMRCVREIYDELCAFLGRTLTITDHQTVLGASYTDCPGSELHTWVTAGMSTEGGSVLTPYHENAILYDNNRIEALISGRDTVVGTPFANQGVGGEVWPVKALKQVMTDVAELKSRPPVQAGPIDAVTLKAVLLDPEVLTAIARAVVAEIAS